MKHAREDYNRIQDPAKIIPDEEPVFLLRGQDKTAAATVRYWASLQANADIAALALSWADEMSKWETQKDADLLSEEQSINLQVFGVFASLERAGVTDFLLAQGPEVRKRVEAKLLEVEAKIAADASE